MLIKTVQKYSKNLQQIFQTPPFFSTTKSLLNHPPVKYTDHRLQLKKNVWRDLDETGKKSVKTHLSNAQQYINNIPVLIVKSDVVRCYGGNQPALAHPVQYIQVNTRTPGQPVTCKYCGIRYALAAGHHH